MGKWSKLKGRFVVLKEDENREKIDAAIADLKKKPNSDIQQVLAAVKDEKKGMEQREYDLNVLVAASEEVMSERWDLDDISSEKHEGLGTFTLSPEPYAQVKDINELRKWLRGGVYSAVTLFEVIDLFRDRAVTQGGHTEISVDKLREFVHSKQSKAENDLIKEEVKWLDLNNMLKDRITNGEELPPESAVKVYLKNKIRFTREKE